VVRRRRHTTQGMKGFDGRLKIEKEGQPPMWCAAKLLHCATTITSNPPPQLRWVCAIVPE